MVADRTIDAEVNEVPEIPEELDRVLVFALEEAKEKMENGDDLVPFTTIIVKDNLFMETHPGETPEECYVDAEHTVRNVSGAGAYAFCYDGYIETDQGVIDAVIAEGGEPGGETGYAIAYLYTANEEGNPVFESEPAFVGEAPNFMAHLKPKGALAEDEAADADEVADNAAEGAGACESADEGATSASEVDDAETVVDEIIGEIIDEA